MNGFGGSCPKPTIKPVLTAVPIVGGRVERQEAKTVNTLSVQAITIKHQWVFLLATSTAITTAMATQTSLGPATVEKNRTK